MKTRPIIDLTECTEFRQTLQARAPAVVHGAAAVLAMLVVAVIAWSGLTPVNLVVAAAGRVRPSIAPHRVYAAVSPNVQGRIVEVRRAEGDDVQAGEVLM